MVVVVVVVVAVVEVNVGATTIGTMAWFMLPVRKHSEKQKGMSGRSRHCLACTMHGKGTQLQSGLCWRNTYSRNLYRCSSGATSSRTFFANSQIAPVNVGAGIICWPHSVSHSTGLSANCACATQSKLNVPVLQVAKMFSYKLSTVFLRCHTSVMNLLCARISTQRSPSTDITGMALPEQDRPAARFAVRLSSASTAASAGCDSWKKARAIERSRRDMAMPGALDG